MPVFHRSFILLSYSGKIKVAKNGQMSIPAKGEEDLVNYYPLGEKKHLKPEKCSENTLNLSHKILILALCYFFLEIKSNLQQRNENTLCEFLSVSKFSFCFR